MKVVVGITGASGSIYGITLIEKLKNRCEIHLIMTDAGKLVLECETDYTAAHIKKNVDYSYDQNEISACLASGSFQFDAMIVVPCSIKTLSAIANSYTENLLIRTADVALKERRMLILCTRETPLHLGHLQLMVKVSKQGAILFPLSPAFYNKPSAIIDIVNNVSDRILDLIGLQNQNAARWSGTLN